MLRLPLCTTPAAQLLNPQQAQHQASRTVWAGCVADDKLAVVVESRSSVGPELQGRSGAESVTAGVSLHKDVEQQTNCVWVRHAPCLANPKTPHLAEVCDPGPAPHEARIEPSHVNLQAHQIGKGSVSKGAGVLWFVDTLPAHAWPAARGPGQHVHSGFLIVAAAAATKPARHACISARSFVLLPLERIGCRCPLPAGAPAAGA